MISVPRRLRELIAPVLGLLPAIAEACSGGWEVQEMMMDSARYGYVLVGISGILTIAAGVISLRRRSPWGFVAATFLLLIHPGWWHSAFIGDCGGFRATGALWATASIGMVLASPLLSHRRGQWNATYALLVLALSIVAFRGLHMGRWGFEALVALIPGLAACCVALGEYVLGDSLAQAFRHRASEGGWRGRALRVLALPTAAVVGLALLLTLAMAGRFASEVRGMVGLGFDPWREASPRD